MDLSTFLTGLGIKKPTLDTSVKTTTPSYIPPKPVVSKAPAVSPLSKLTIPTSIFQSATRTPSPVAPFVASTPTVSAPVVAPPVVTSTKIPIVLGNGTTVYVDNKTGVFSDANGNVIPNSAIQSAISPSLTRSDYVTTDDGKKAVANSVATPTGVLSTGVNAALGSIPPETFSSLTPQLVPGSPEYQAAMDAIDTSFYDILQQQATASNEQEHTIANYNWNQLKNYIEKNLNITLKSDSVQAWDQLQSLKGQYGNLNLENSGFQNEAVDRYLSQVRANNDAQRLTALTKQEEQEANYYQNYATVDQIAAFAAANPDKARSYGLIPSDGKKSLEQRAAEMKEKFPTMSDEAISQNLATMYDKNGYLLSGLNQKYMTGTNKSADTGKADPAQTTYDSYGNITGYGNIQPTDTGILDINATRRQNKQMNVEAASAAKGLEAAAAAKASTAAAKLAGETDPAGSQFIRTNDSRTQGTAGLPSTGSPSASISTPIPSTGSAGQENPYTFTLLPNGNVRGYNKKTNTTTQGTADYMKTLGYKS